MIARLPPTLQNCLYTVGQSKTGLSECCLKGRIVTVSDSEQRDKCCEITQGLVQLERTQISTHSFIDETENKIEYNFWYCSSNQEKNGILFLVGAGVAFYLLRVKGNIPYHQNMYLEKSFLVQGLYKNKW